MKFSIAKDELTTILGTVLKGMSSRSTLPILSGILLSAEDNSVTFQTTDLEISIRHIAAANVEERGKAVVPGKLFSDIVKSLPDAAINIVCDSSTAQISCLDSTFTLSALNPSDFPYFPDVEVDTTIELPSSKLASVVKKVSKAVSRDESRAILTGVQLTLEGTRARFIATDSYRLAVAYMDVEGQEYEPFQVVIPGKTLDDVSRLATSVENVTIGFSENQVIFKFGNTVFVSRKIEGTYPNCMQLISEEYELSAHVDTTSLVTAIKRVSLLAQSHSPVHLQFSMMDQQITVSAKTQDVGGAVEKISAQIDGEDMEIAFNHQYVLDGLSSIEGDTRIELQSSFKPGVLKDVDDANFIYLAMPVRLS